jgi:hypothetical protein
MRVLFFIKFHFYAVFYSQRLRGNSDNKLNSESCLTPKVAQCRNSDFSFCVNSGVLQYGNVLNLEKYLLDVAFLTFYKLKISLFISTLFVLLILKAKKIFKE